MLAGYWNIDRGIYHYVHLVNINLPAQRYICINLVEVKRLELCLAELSETVKSK